MRPDQSNRNSKVEGVFGIRTPIWLIAFVVLSGLAIVCERQHRAMAPAHKIAADAIRERDHRSVGGSGSAATTIQTEVRPEALEDRASFDVEEFDFDVAEQIIQDRRMWSDHGIRLRYTLSPP